MTARRLATLPAHALADGLILLEARTARSRLVGLAGLAALPPRHALLLPGCRSVHTFGMRFELDLVFLDGNGRALRFDARVPPRRLRACAGARDVIEARAGEGYRFARVAEAH